MKTFKKMYEEAARKINTEKHNGNYKGYTEANALSLYVYEKYGVNAADNSAAHDALCDVMQSSMMS